MKNIIIFISVLTASTLLLSCGSKSESNIEEGHGEVTHSEHNENENTATLTAEQIKSIKIKLGNIEKKQLTTSLKANGLLKVPNNNRANATVASGWCNQIDFGANRKHR